MANSARVYARSGYLWMPFQLSAMAIEIEGQVQFRHHTQRIMLPVLSEVGSGIAYAYMGKMNESAPPRAYHTTPQTPIERRQIADSTRGVVCAPCYHRIGELNKAVALQRFPCLRIPGGFLGCKACRRRARSAAAARAVPSNP